MIPLYYGDTIPLFVALADETTDKVVKADIIDMDSYAILNDDVTLSFESGTPGYYTNYSLTMPYKRAVQAIFSVYESDGTTLITKGDESFALIDWTAKNCEPITGEVIDNTVVGEIYCD